LTDVRAGETAATLGEPPPPLPMPPPPLQLPLLPPPPLQLPPPPPMPMPPPIASDRRPDRRAALPITDRRLRRIYGWETVIVLSIFPLGSTILAVTLLLMHVTRGVEHSKGGMVIRGEPWISFPLALGLAVSGFAAAALVLFLLIRNGEGIESIGLGGHRLKKDLALVLPVWILVQAIPTQIGSSLVTGFHIPTYTVSGPPVPTAFLAIGLLLSLQAGVVEEVVVLGYLVRRLEQRGWSAAAVVVIAVLVRVSYHLYYGPGILPIVLWATASVLVYRWLRRLLPFIICHVVWDSRIAIKNYVSSTAADTFVVVFLVFALVCTVLWIREPTAQPVPAPSP
jgi:membrane protease YdiL (CAAX protease family)